MVPADHVRMRRDFRQLLTVIETIAMLYQRQRESDGDGRIVATLDDYGRARTLLIDVFQVATSGGVTAAVRDTVDAVSRLYADEPLTKQQVADELGLSKDTAWHRVKRAISLGYLSNDEARKGRPAQIRPGEPLPGERPALPTVTDLRSRVSERPETLSTLQPRPRSEAVVESDEEVERGVEIAVQPGIQPGPASVSESAGGADERVVERLNQEPKGLHTRRPAARTDEWEDIRI
jgi:biotin operon repressor